MTKYRFPKDPHAAREHENYENPLPSREYIALFIEENGGHLSFNRLAKLFSITEEESLLFKRRLGAMCRDGQLICDKRGKYSVVTQLNLVKGYVIAHKDGYGFLHSSESPKDFYLSARQMQKLMHGDAVIARITEDETGRKEAKVIEVTERALDKIVGQLYFDRGIAYIEPDQQFINNKIVIPAENTAGACEGQLVVAQIIHYPDGKTHAIGRITDILGDFMAPGIEIDVALHAHQIPHTWPDDIEKDLQLISDSVSQKEFGKRIDLRSKSFVTIDGEDAKDFDDAVYCEPIFDNGWRLFVAIADVAHYVKSGNILDIAAKQRTTSVYFPGRVIPMLPEKLSNGICSLKPQVDRLVLVCELEFNQSGERKSYKFYEGIIHSKARLTYTQVANILGETDYADLANNSHLLPHIYNLNSLYELLHKKRNIEGMVDFPSNESRIIFNKDKKIERIEAITRNVAHRIIEEAMLSANVAASEFALKNKLPILYRNHDLPPAEKLKDLRNFLRNFSLQISGGDFPQTKDYANLLAQVADRKDAHLLQMAILRSMSQAEYSLKNEGHFGLGFLNYTHFTSPIRRYPDLLLHRAIKSKLSQHEIVMPKEELAELGRICSFAERRADNATRDVTNWLKCEYMHDKIGEVYSGIITGVTNFGLFVELDNLYVEGMLHVSKLIGDYYNFDSDNKRLVGQSFGKSFQLGDIIKVQVVAVNINSRQIDFGYLPTTKKTKKKKQRKAKGNNE